MNLVGFDICIVLCFDCKIWADTPRNSIVRTKWEFEMCTNVVILEFLNVYIVMCPTKEGPMKVMNSYRLKMFLDVKTEVPTMVTSSACLRRRVRCVLISSAKF